MLKMRFCHCFNEKIKTKIQKIDKRVGLWRLRTLPSAPNTVTIFESTFGSIASIP